MGLSYSGKLVSLLEFSMNRQMVSQACRSSFLVQFLVRSTRISMSPEDGAAVPTDTVCEPAARVSIRVPRLTWYETEAMGLFLLRWSVYPKRRKQRQEGGERTVC